MTMDAQTEIVLADLMKEVQVAMNEHAAARDAERAACRHLNAAENRLVQTRQKLAAALAKSQMFGGEFALMNLRTNQRVGPS